MAVSKKGRQTTPQLVATLFGGALLLLLIIVLVGSVIQGSRRPPTESAMQRALSARVHQYYFIGDEFSMDNGTLHVKGHFSGTPQDVPQNADEWQALTEDIAQAYAAELKGVAKSVSVEHYYNGELIAKVEKPVS